MNTHQTFKIKNLSLWITLAVSSSVSHAAYQQGSSIIATIEQGERVERHEALQPSLITAYAQLKYRIDLNPQWHIEPQLNLSYSQLKTPAFRETGVGALEVDAYRSRGLNLSIGQRLQAHIDHAYGRSSIAFDSHYRLPRHHAALNARFHSGSAFAVTPEASGGAELKHSLQKSGSAWSGGVQLDYEF